MLRTPKKRGRPRKYYTPEDKAKQDVVAKRAKRRLQKQPTHGDIRFQSMFLHRQKLCRLHPHKASSHMKRTFWVMLQSQIAR
ncbi:hypothetical protein H9L39_18266 [Fusarium oxysporum f. sp. albedinis]|nr:hypothetical protein H9L39_18266 [Fusarium oxysporum f. sp. albedinis]